MKKYFVKLPPRGSSSHLTSSRTFLGTFISSKTPGMDFKDIERERVKNVWSFWSLWGRGCSWHSLGWCQGAMRTPRKLHKKFFHNQTSGSTLKNMAYGGSFWAPGPPKWTFIESKRCPFLFILSMEQDGVFQKILTSPISKTNIFFWDTLYINNKHVCLWYSYTPPLASTNLILTHKHFNLMKTYYSFIHLERKDKHQVRVPKSAGRKSVWGQVGL